MYLHPLIYKYWRARIYMRSPYWYALRLKVKKHYNIRGRVDIHHVTYERIGRPEWYHFIPFVGKYFVTGRERIKDLRAVTREQHNKIHNVKG